MKSVMIIRSKLNHINSSLQSIFDFLHFLSHCLVFFYSLILQVPLLNIIGRELGYKFWYIKKHLEF